MSVEALSDSELRSKLAEYGYPVGPVTLTTRKILVKKLKNLIETRGSAGSRHSLAARYSSDETDEDATASAVRKKKSTNSRRQTLANPMPPPPSVPPVPATAPAPRSPPKRRTPSRNLETRGSTADEYDHSSSELSNRMTSKTVQKKYTKTYKLSTSNDGLETGSDSDVTEEADKIYNSTKFGMDTDKLYDYKPSERSYPEYDSLKTYDSRPRNVHTTKDDRYSAPLFKPNLSPVQPTNEDTYGRDSLSKDDPLANFKTPYLSEFTRRLSLRTNANLPSSSRSTLSSPLLRPTSTSGLPEVKESDSNGHYSNLRPSYLTSGLSSRYATLTASRPRDVTTRRFKPSDSKEVKNNHNMISLVLVGVVALFFVVLAVVYLGLGGKTEDTPSLSSEEDVIPLCTPGISGERNKPGVNCILKENVEDVYLLLKRIRPILKEKAISAACDGSNEKPYLTDKDIVKRFTSEKAPGFQVKNDLRDAQLLIFNNPDWGISLIEVSDTDEESNQALDTMDKLFQARLEGKLGMVESSLDLPLQCLLAQKLYTIFSSLLIVAVGLLIVVATQKFLVWYLLYKKRAEREVFQLVSEIITMVEAHHQNTAVTSPGGTEESYVAINHVRDNLIAPKDRKRMAKLWEQAVKYLDQNDSRIRREVQVVAGDEFDVWRWLSSNNLNASGSQISPINKKTKVWQGQAFETMEGSVNSLTCSPTPCLKIRHMFDPDVEFEEDWETKVQDAILEKCGEGVKILHIRVDRGSREGCVYMKCFSQEDAGKAYRALHGWWFDSNLVTVKYLRLERYHERFPDATRCTAALKPSNNQRLSMQAHYWQSPLETN